MKIATDGTTFLRLPTEMQRPIKHGCCCSYCKAHPDKVPKWDTLAGHPDARHTWTVHYPELDEQPTGDNWRAAWRAIVGAVPDK